jgi:cyanophycin synthetase
MQVSRIRALRGPNLWSRHTAMEAIVTCTPEGSGLSAQHPIEQQLRRIFPEVGPFDGQRPGEAATLAHALEKVTLSLQIHAGCPVSFSRTTPTEEPGVFQVVVQNTEEAVGRLALELATQLCQAAIQGIGFDLEAAMAQLHELDEDVRLGPSTGAITDAAVARGIPIRRLTPGSLVQLGWGAQQRRIQAAETDTTSAIAESIAQDKDLTKSLLHAAGVPVPTGRPAHNLAEAWAIA